MLSKILNRIFLVITSREVFLLLGLFLAVLSVPMIREQYLFVRDYVPGLGHDPEHAAEGIVDGLAGIFVAAGVFMESRDTIRKMATEGPHDAPLDAVETRLNEVAHQNGMGILIVGLLMEIGTLLIGLPERVMNAKRFERGIYATCAVLSCLALVILYDFVKDYVLTYRMKR
jgi:hypothetical protein